MKNGNQPRLPEDVEAAVAVFSLAPFYRSSFLRSTSSSSLSLSGSASKPSRSLEVCLENKSEVAKLLGVPELAKDVLLARRGSGSLYRPIMWQYIYSLYQRYNLGLVGTEGGLAKAWSRLTLSLRIFPEVPASYEVGHMSPRLR